MAGKSNQGGGLMLTCSFCGKTQGQVAKLATNGEGLAFCNECAQVVLDMVEDERAQAES